MTIAEPATTLTDYLMGGLAVSFAVDLGRRAVEAGHARWWSRAFAFLAASALAGGTYHGFQSSFPPWLTDGLWRSGLAAAALSSFAMMRAVALQWLGSGPRSFWAVAAAFKLATALVVGILHADFLVVVVDFGLTMLFAASVGIAAGASNPRALLSLAAGIALFVAGALIQQGQLSPHPAFNHNDLFHVIQILGNTCFFLSARFGRSTPWGSGTSSV